MVRIVSLFLIFYLFPLFADENVSLQLKWKHSFQFAGFYMAKEKGFYKEVGLDVTLRELESKVDLVQSVVNREANYGVGDSALIYYKLQKQPIVLMMPILDHSPLALLTTRDDVKSLLDFKVYKKILINETSLKSPAILSMLYASGIDIKKLQPINDVFRAEDIARGELDLYTVYAPEQPYYLKKHHIKYQLFSPIDYGLDFYGDMLFTSNHELDNHFDRAVRFMDASKKGWQYAFEHIDETIRVIQRKYNSQHYSKDELLYQAYAYRRLASKSYKFDKQRIDTAKIIFQLLYKTKNNFSYADFVFNRYIATKSEREFLKKHKVRCISTANWPPFNLVRNGEVVGVAIDYWHIVAEKLHIDNRCEKAQSFSEVLDAVKTKKADLTVSTSETPERKKYAIFSKEYAIFPIAVATKKGVTYTPDIEAIKEKSFALVKNHTATKLLLEKIPNLHYIETDTLQEALSLVERFEVDATAEILPVLAYTINSGDFNNLEITGMTELRFPVKFMIRKDYTELLSMINRVIDSIDEHTRKQIYDRWISVNVKTGYSQHQIDKFLLIGMVVFFFFLLWIVILLLQIRKRKRVEAQLEKLANYDKLTSIYNRSKIDEFLKQQIEIVKRYHKPLSIIFFDIDNFKSINDTFGHKVGDEVLKEIPSLVAKHIRKSDIFGRWGGEEFLIICPEIDLENATKLAEKLRKVMQEHQFTDVGKVTCSFGVFEVGQNSSIDEAMKEVDKLLYIAKKSGRNKVVSDTH